ncbi:unnamed protein product, partial [Discosporangium mesarthrocarpum]
GSDHVLRCAGLVFQELCVLSSGEQGHWIKRTTISTSRALGLELVEQVLTQQPMLFRHHPPLRALLANDVVPLLLQILRQRVGFPLVVRVTRAAGTFMVNYGDILPAEGQAIFSIMVSCLGASGGDDIGDDKEGVGQFDFSPWQEGADRWPAMLTMEAMHRVLTHHSLLLTLFRQGSMHTQRSRPGCTSAVHQMVQGASHHLLRSLSSPQSTAALDSMAEAIRSGRKAPQDAHTPMRRLPVPAPVAHAVGKGKGKGKGILTRKGSGLVQGGSSNG